MALILHIETSTETCSVALSEDKQLLNVVEKTEKNIHASELTLFIQQLMRAAKRELTDLDAVSVSMGPGSYTGLRIGVSTAKGLCYALDIPLIGVNTLAAMAYGFMDKYFAVRNHTLFCPMIDARRMEVYTAVFDSERNLVKGTQALIVDQGSFKDLLDTHVVYFFGNGAAKCEGILGSHLNARILDTHVNSASDLLVLAHDKYERKEFEDIAYFEPYYLKDYIAGKKKQA